MIKHSGKILLFAFFFSGCFISQKNALENNLYNYSDLHNSILSANYPNIDLDFLHDSTVKFNLYNPSKNKNLKILSIGIARFDMQNPEIPTIKQLLIYLKKLNTAIKSNDKIALITSKKDYNIAVNNKKQAIMLSLEGSHLLKGELHWIDSLYEYGVRMISPAHWFVNEFFTCNEPIKIKGPQRLTDSCELSPKGILLIEKLIDKNVIINTSHLPERAFWQVVKINQNKTALIASHSNSYSITKTPRNLRDNQIIAIAKSGGIIGICFHAPLLNNNATNSSIQDIVKHIIYISDLVGTEHIAIGSDFYGRIKLPSDFKQNSSFLNLCNSLKEAGFSNTEIKKIFETNALKLLN